MKIQKEWICALAAAVCLAVSGCGAKAPADGTAAGEMSGAGGTDEAAETDKVSGSAAAGQAASENETGSRIEVVKEGMAPVYGTELRDGVYPVEVDSSSSMFRITSCELTVKDGAMSAVMTMGGTGYLKLYMGTGGEALKAVRTDYIPYAETADGLHTYKIPVEALDRGIDCAAFSKNKEKWYDRVLVFRSDSLPGDAFAGRTIATAESLELEDGSYMVEVALEGGSGRASVESPAKLRVEGGKAVATLVWGSANYDYMKVNGGKFEAVSMEPYSAFEIPVSGFDWRMPVIADTIAMSQPHEIDYILIFDSASLKKAE